MAKPKLEVKYRIGNTTALMMVLIATLIWGLQVILELTGLGEIVSWLLGLITDIVFLVWFSFAGINWFGRNSAQKILFTLGLDVMELVPFFSIIPFDLIDVLLLIWISRREDRDHAKKTLATAANDNAKLEAAEREAEHAALVERLAADAERQRAA